MKRVVALFLIMLVLCAVFLSQSAYAVPVAVNESGVPEISAKSCIVIDAETGAVIYEKDADTPMGIASTTKILTALLVLENCYLDDIVTIKKEWTGIEGSSMLLKPGEQLTVEAMLYGLLLHSGNDAAHALACYVGGSIDKFADMMNARVTELGCTNSHFENPHGLDGKTHLATARDLAIITREAMKNEKFADIVSTTKIGFGKRVFENHNKLLGLYEGTIGVKTGYTIAAGRSLVSCAVRDDMRVIIVTLDDRDDWVDHANLYDWAFNQYETLEIKKGEPISAVLPVISVVKATVSLTTSENISVKLPKNSNYTLTIEAPKFVYAVVVRGGIAGQLVVRLNGRVMASAPLVFAETVRQAENERLTAYELIKRSWYMANEYSGYQMFGYY